MGKTYETLEGRVADFVRRQHLFFVATAPLADRGLLNLSPKGLDTFRILGPREVAYLDLVGSGVETIAHLRENGRIVLMFCAFEGPPNIVRLHGCGEAVEPGEPGFDSLCEKFDEYPGVRSVIRIDVKRISDSCGFGVPLFEHRGERDQLPKWSRRQGEAALREYEEKNNRVSLDGLPGLRRASSSRD